jgi:hypothetical protein
VKLTDNSGGFWADIIIRRKSADMALRSRVEPNIAVMEVLGNEMIQSVKGGAKSLYNFTRSAEGDVIVTKIPCGDYKFGIAKGTDYTGAPLAPLSEVTLKIREKVKGISRKGAFILRETSEHIFNGLHITHLAGKSNTSGRNRVEIGWNKFDEQLVMLNEQDRMVTNPLVEYRGKDISAPDVFVAARKIRGYSAELRENIIQILHNWINS